MIYCTITERCPAPKGEGMYTPEDSPVETTEEHADYLEANGYGQRLETKDDWYSEAMRFGIPGRSDMTKDELIDAIITA